MLRSELVRPRLQINKKRIQPRLLPADYHWLEVAGELRQIVQTHVGQSRGVLWDALKRYEGDSLDYPILRGLSAVLEQAAVFGNNPPLAPDDLRSALFAKGPTSPLASLWTRGRSEVMGETAVELNLTPSQLEASLFADLAEEQLLIDVSELPAPAQLIARYNLEVARGLLYWSKEVTLTAYDSYKDLFKFIKLFKLMHTIQPWDDGYKITLHGPISPFVNSTMRYGLQFAKFMPALLLCQRWHMQAQVRPPHTDGFLLYELDDSTSLVSHFKGSGLFDSKLEQNFATEFEAKYTRNKRKWELTREDTIIDLGDTVMLPDFSLTSHDGRKLLIEIVGFWHPSYLKRKLAKVKAAKLPNLLLLVYESANISAESFEAVANVLRFAKKPVLKEVLAAAEQYAV